MPTRKRKTGCRIVIKGSAPPLNRRMTRLTGCRESGRLMVWIRGALEIWQVACRTSVAQPGEPAAHMA